MPLHIRPSIRMAALPNARPFYDRLRLAAEAGFEGVEVEVSGGAAGEIREAADRAGIVVHSVHCQANYSQPLSSGDPATRAAGIEATIGAIEAARILGADTMLLIPGKVDDETSYGEVYARSQEVIRREILPVAERCGIVLGIENVWNGFLLSPIDFARYVEAFESPFVRAYLDVGNIVFGRAEGWIDILGPLIAKLHLKDFRFDAERGRFGIARIGEGSIDWPRVRAALERIGYSGWAVLAEAERVQGRVARRVFQRARRASPNPAVGAVQTYLSGRLLADVMARFRRHIA
jgi:hexulose-6-phosphate isomerase